MRNIIHFEYEGHPVFFNEEGWINATDIASKYGKKPAKWKELPSTKSYIKSLANALNMGNVRKSDFGLIVTKRGGFNAGTWIHPKLAVSFARWLSDDFAVWCDLKIDELIRSHQPSFTDQRINAIFLLDKPVPWEKQFQQPFYQALSRMSGLPYHGHVGGTPSLFGMITAKWVYQVVLPDSVYVEAREAAKGSGDKIHQYLKPEAKQLVQEQLKAITILANSCVDYKDFEARCVQSFGKSGEQGLLILPMEREFSYSAMRH